MEAVDDGHVRSDDDRQGPAVGEDGLLQEVEVALHDDVGVVVVWSEQGSIDHFDVHHGRQERWDGHARELLW